MPEKNKSLFLRLAELLARAIYRVQAYGAEKLPGEGFLLVPNHITWIDAIVLQIACPHPVRFMVYEEIYKLPALNWVFRIFNAIPISSRHAKDAIRAAVERLKEGEIVCIFPEGELTRSGTLLKLQRGFELIAKQANVPVVPVWMDQLWGSVFSFHGGKYFRKIPRRIPYPVTVSFGEPIAPAEATVALVRERMLILGEQAYQRRAFLRGHLAEACIRGLKRRQFDPAIFDGMDGSVTSRGTVLAASIALSRYLRRQCPGRRVAVVLPPGRAAVVANAALMLAGKVPVNLNFTAGRGSVEAAIRIAGIQEVITAGPVMKRLPDFPWPEKLLRIEEILPAMKKKIILWRIVALLPWRLLALLLGTPSRGDHEEAVILFTSGSAGEPKGVVLSHRNLLGNVSQFSSMLDLHREDAVLGCLPFFHSFGCTVTLWYPLIEGIRLVTYPNPLDTAKNVELIEKHKVSLLISTPTFLRGYLRKAEPAQLASLKLLVTGAEKLPAELAKAFEEKFKIPVQQGYGLTETSPVVSTNLPDPEKYRPADNVQSSSRFGSVGKLAPGMAGQIRDPDSGEPMDMHQTGMLWLRGPNIFEGYLNDPARTAAVVKDGWFKTGDLGRFDDDGFLFIEGRLSRFSKIGGEMIPHETVESKIREVLKISPDDHCIAVTGVPDEAKGEALVLLTTQDIDSTSLRTSLNAIGIPNLWVPKRIQKVDAIPSLATGKLDLKGIRELALNG
ncbi:MAG TPA: AMP-binding protein [Chthoniobacteraceae bacterium]|jgi:acyl-[acyl-carrier-protein]-phospholipid O-acyltransferase/long-chain-fatty-acid--[acyl-carrier-protein] ligase|nr:AMP-binding protein [Chthoniobacteraceae bacterium]